MIKHILSLLLIIILLTTGCEQNANFQMQVINPLDFPRSGAVISVPLSDLKARHPQFNFEKFTITENGAPLAFEIQDGKLLILVAQLKNGQTTLQFDEGNETGIGTPKRTQAEISVRHGGHFEKDRYVDGSGFENVSDLFVPQDHVAHDDFIRYEGPGWESDKVGYRLYLDDRNAIDIFGKKTGQMILQHVGQDTSASYHEMQWWGMDIFKVGNALGIGAPAALIDGKAQRIETTDSMRCRISQNGTLRSAVSLSYYGWQTSQVNSDLHMQLSIEAGSRLTKNEIHWDNPDRSLCTGLIKSENAEYFTSPRDGSGDWRYIAFYGDQSLAGDKLGTAVFYRQSDAAGLSEDGHNRLIVFKPGLTKLHYYFAAAWQGEPDGIKNKEAFKIYLDKETDKFNHPPQITF